MVDENKKSFPWAVVGGGIVFVLIGMLWIFLSRQPVPERTPLSSTKAAVTQPSSVLNHPTLALIPSVAPVNRLPTSTALVALKPTSQNPAQIPRATLDQSKTAFDSGAAVFLDVRAASSYTKSHIPGAVNIPIGELVNRLQELNPSSWIITYCT